VVQLAPHTFRHLRLSDLARAEWTIDRPAARQPAPPGRHRQVAWHLPAHRHDREGRRCRMQAEGLCDQCQAEPHGALDTPNV